MKFKINKTEYGKPQLYRLIPETEFEESFLSEIFLKDPNSGLRPLFLGNDGMYLEVCKAVKIEPEDEAGKENE